MTAPAVHMGTVYGQWVRFVREPPAPDHQRGVPLHLCVVLEDLVKALDLRPATVSVLTGALAMHTGCGCGSVKIGWRTWGAPHVDFARWIVMDPLALGCIGRRAVAEFERAVADDKATLAAVR